MELLHTVVSALVTLGVLITVHEFGHFWVARRCGVRVERFSIGFGPPLLTWRDSRGTEYVLAAVPLGGYVKMLDAREAPVAEDERAQEFTSKPLRSRAAIVAAGPLANFGLAILAFWVMYLVGVSGVAPVIDGVEPGSVAARAGLEVGQEVVAVDGRPTNTVQSLAQGLAARMGDTGNLVVSVKHPGSTLVYDAKAEISSWLADVEEPDPIKGFGIKLWRPKFEAVVKEVVSGGPAEVAGMKPGDRLLAVDGLPLADWQAWVEYVRARPGLPISVTLDRSGQSLTVSVVPETVDLPDAGRVGQVGVMASPPEWPVAMIREERYGPIGAVVPAFLKTWDTATGTLDALRKMLVGLISPKNLSGPITIAKVASSSAKSGLSSYLALLGLLSVSLGVLNLLPIPVLDGGHLLFYGIEWIKGSALSEGAQALGLKIGMAFVLCVMLLAFYNDLSRL